MAPPGLKESIPYDLEAEKSVLGSALRDPQCTPDVISFLKEDDFYSPRHRGLFAIIQALEERNTGSSDAITVAHEMERRQSMDELGGRAYLEELMATVPSLAFLENHLKIVRDLALRRGLIRAADDIIRQATESPEEVQDLVDAAEQTVFDVGDRLVHGQIKSAKELIKEQIDAILSNEQGNQGLKTGYLDLDERQGFRPGDLLVLAARPAMGKTALALNILKRVALQEEKAVLFFSLEMPSDQILMRLLAEHSRVRHDALRRGRLGATDRQKITLSAGELSNGRIFLDDSSQPSLAEIRAKARRLRREGNLDLVMVDYLQLLGARAESRQQEIATISRNLKALARDLEIPVLTLAQLNRAAEKRDSHRPMLSDLRESGAIEQDADMVMLLYREEYYNPSEENEGMAELIIAKNRHGSTGSVRMRFDKEFMRFENAVKETEF